MTREIGPELVARLRHVADSLEAIARGEVDSPQPFIAAYAVYLNGEYDSSYGPDAIDEALEIAADCHGEVVPLYRTPQAHATPGEGSVRRNCSVESRETVQQEPVAWAILHKDHQYVSLLREHAQAHNVYTDAEIVPLYRSPDAERLANARLSAANVMLVAQRDSLRAAIRRLADQDATLSVQDGNVTVTMEGTLSDEEWDEIEGMISDYQEIAEFNEERCHPHYAEKARRRAAMLIGLLERLG